MLKNVEFIELSNRTGFIIQIPDSGSASPLSIYELALIDLQKQIRELKAFESYVQTFGDYKKSFERKKQLANKKP
jgi:hypothetical protein